jgi:tripartite-type tricarboxylate transporter receptor subunit TctC
MNRRWFAAAACAAVAGLVLGPAAAQGYPSKPVRIIVPFPAGGGYDFNARNIAQKLTESLGQPVVVENRAGANGNIGSDVAAKAPPDGHTLLLGGIGPQALSVALYPKLPYDPERDLAPISLVAAQPNLLVVKPALQVKSLAELIQFAKANPGKLSVGSAGNGSGQHFGLEQLKQDAGIDAVHVPYKGAAPLHAALLGGEIDAAFNIIQLPMPQVRKGELRALAIASKRRSALAPEIPTMAELGYAIDFDTWYGLYAPAGTPRDILQRLHAETLKALQAADYKERAAALGVELIGSTPEELAAHQRAEIARWTKIGKAANIKVD